LFISQFPSCTITTFQLSATAYSQYSRLHFVGGASRFSDALGLCLSTETRVRLVGLDGRCDGLNEKC